MLLINSQSLGNRRKIRIPAKVEWVDKPSYLDTEDEVEDLVPIGIEMSTA